MNISKKTPFLFTILFLFFQVSPSSANTFFYLPVLYAYLNTTTTLEEGAALMAEICNNGIDDDGDGAIDGADLDCQCEGSDQIIIKNLISNGQFDDIVQCCGTLNTNTSCLENWIIPHGSPDYFSDNCPDTDLRPDVRALARNFDTEEVDTYIHSLISGGNGTYFTESFGICFDEPKKIRDVIARQS